MNDLTLTEIPTELSDMNPLELRLISKRIPFMKLVALPKGGQKSIQGPAVNVPTEIDTICNVLPRIPTNAHLVDFKLKRKLSHRGHYMHEYVRPDKVMNAIIWLKNNNSLYEDVSIIMNWQKQWQQNDRELFEAMIIDTNELETAHSLEVQLTEAKLRHQVI